MKQVFIEIYEKIKYGNYTPYCKLCDSCGESGCCSPISCMFKCMIDYNPDKCKYGEKYAEDIYFSYLLADMYQNYTYKLEQKEITIEQYLEITKKEWDELYDIAYAVSIERNLNYKNSKDGKIKK